MAEIIKTKLRIAGIYSTAAVNVVDETTARAATWVPEPLTLASDELTIVESEASVDPILCHEYDVPLDYDFEPGTTEAGGSFVEMTKAQLADLIGGTATAKAYSRALGKAMLEKTLLFLLRNGGAIVMPKAVGYALLNMNLSRAGGRFKVPFKFYPTLKEGSETDFIMIDDFEMD